MSVQMNGFNIKGSVFAGVAVLPGSADPTKFIVSPAVTPSPANKEGTTLVTLRDSFNNIMGTPYDCECMYREVPNLRFVTLS